MSNCQVYPDGGRILKLLVSVYCVVFHLGVNGKEKVAQVFTLICCPIVVFNLFLLIRSYPFRWYGTHLEQQAYLVNQLVYIVAFSLLLRIWLSFCCRAA